MLGNTTLSVIGTIWLFQNAGQHYIECDWDHMVIPECWATLHWVWLGPYGYSRMLGNTTLSMIGTIWLFKNTGQHYIECDWDHMVIQEYWATLHWVWLGPYGYQECWATLHWVWLGPYGYSRILGNTTLSVIGTIWLLKNTGQHYIECDWDHMVIQEWQNFKLSCRPAESDHYIFHWPVILCSSPAETSAEFSTYVAVRPNPVLPSCYLVLKEYWQRLEGHVCTFGLINNKLKRRIANLVAIAPSACDNVCDNVFKPKQCISYEKIAPGLPSHYHSVARSVLYERGLRDHALKLESTSCFLVVSSCEYFAEIYGS
jgi:hypothetical protein